MARAGARSRPPRHRWVPSLAPARSPPFQLHSKGTWRRPASLEMPRQCSVRLLARPSRTRLAEPHPRPASILIDELGPPVDAPQSSLLETDARPRARRAAATGESRTPGLSPLVNSTPA